MERYLCAAFTSGNVKGNHFGTEEVVAGFNITGDRNVLLSTVVVENIGSPVICRNQTILVDLEPRRSGI
jgi:hypothetical protein